MKNTTLFLSAVLMLCTLVTASCEKEKPLPQEVVLVNTQWEGSWEYSRTTGGQMHHFKQNQTLTFENDSNGLYGASSYLDGQFLYTVNSNFDYHFDGVSSGELTLYMDAGEYQYQYTISYNTPSETLYLIREVSSQYDTLVFHKKNTTNM